MVAQGLTKKNRKKKKSSKGKKIPRKEGRSGGIENILKGRGKDLE